MPHNPPYYATLLERAGFQKAKGLLAYQRSDTGLPERLVHGASLTERCGMRVRPLDPRRFEDEVAVIKRLYNASWERNWGFVPMTDHEIDHLAKQLNPVVVPEIVLFAERGDETVGFAVALPDLNVALRASDAKLVPVIRACHARSRATYGSPRIHQDLRALDYGVSRKRVARLMRREGSFARPPRRYRVTTASNHTRPVAPTVVARKFQADGPDRVGH